MEVLSSRWTLAAAAAAVASPQIRGVLRKGVVYGLAGVIKAGQTVYQAAQETASEAEETAQQLGRNGPGQPDGRSASGGRRAAASPTPGGSA